MANNNDKVVETKEQQLLGKISTFASSNRKWILIGLIAVVVILFAVIIITTVSNKNQIKAFESLASYEDKFEQIVATDDDEAAVNSYLAGLESLIKGSSYVSVKSAYVIGEYYAVKENWAKAYDYYMKAYNLNPKMYLGTIAVFDAAVCEDEQGNSANALALYQQVAESDDNLVLAAKALFNVARIYYEQNNTELAKVTFQQLIDTYSYSEYAKIAMNIVSAM